MFLPALFQEQYFFLSYHTLFLHKETNKTINTIQNSMNNIHVPFDSVLDIRTISLLIHDMCRVMSRTVTKYK